MNYDIVLSPQEIKILNSCVGENFSTLEIGDMNLYMFQGPGCGIEISTDDCPTPEPKNHLASVVRITVGKFQLPKGAQEYRQEFGVGFGKKEISKEVGQHLSVDVLQSCILFTDIEHVEEIIAVGNAKIPTTSSWNLVRYNPNHPEVQFIRKSPDVGKSVVIADLGLNFTFSTLSLCVYTTGVVTFIEHTVNALPSKLEECTVLIKIQ